MKPILLALGRVAFALFAWPIIVAGAVLLIRWLVRTVARFYNAQNRPGDHHGTDLP